MKNSSEINPITEAVRSVVSDIGYLRCITVKESSFLFLYLLGYKI